MRNSLSFLPCLILIFLATNSAAKSPSASRDTFVDRHAENIVEWQEWDGAKPTEAASLSKPLFFFVGHFANSLTRAMANETFANQTIAKMVNDTTLPIAVDVNEHPELAAFLFQLAETNFEARDWPLCIWTTSDLAPLSGGGYFPPTDDWGGQGFLSLGRNVHEQWESEKDNFISTANDRLQRATQKKAEINPLLSQAVANALEPQPDVQALRATSLRALAKIDSQETRSTIAERIDSILLSAGFDSIEGGFFIGSNDPHWKLPLFQKSLSDQALLLMTLLELNETNPKDGYASAISLTTKFIDQQRTKSNGLHSQYLDSFAPGETMDAIEGSHYLINADDFESIDQKAAEAWDLDEKGNLDEQTDVLGIFQGLNVPRNVSWATLAKENDAARNTLVQLRSKKPTPASDNTGYTSTNALLAQAFAQSRDKAMIRKAVELLKAIEAANTDKVSGKLFNSDAKTQAASTQAYANLIAAYLDTFEATKKAKFKKAAIALQDRWSNDPRFTTENPCELKIASGINASITRDLDLPSAAATQLANLKRLAKITGKKRYKALADQLSANFPASIEKAPENYLSLLVELGQ